MLLHLICLLYKGQTCFLYIVFCCYMFIFAKFHQPLYCTNYRESYFNMFVDSSNVHNGHEAIFIWSEWSIFHKWPIFLLRLSNDSVQWILQIVNGLPCFHFFSNFRFGFLGCRKHLLKTMRQVPIVLGLKVKLLRSRSWMEVTHVRYIVVKVQYIIVSLIEYFVSLSR